MESAVQTTERAPRKYTKAPMTLKSRLLLEALRKFESATIYDLALVLSSNRDGVKSVVGTLMLQGFITRTKERVANGKGSEPAEFAWSGKAFPASEAVFRPTERPCADVQLLVNSMNAMVHAGRAPA